MPSWHKISLFFLSKKSPFDGAEPLGHPPDRDFLDRLANTDIDREFLNRMYKKREEYESSLKK